MNKKGVSAVVATVLIVMITVAAAGLLWGIVAPVLKTQVSEKESCVNAQVSMSVDEDSRYTCVSSDNGTVIRVHRGADNEEWRAVQVIYTDSNGNSQTVEYTSPPGINSEKVFKNVEIRDVISIAVVPILANNGNDLVCAKVVEIAPVKNCSSEVSTTITNDGTSPEYSGSGGGITGSVIDNCYGDSDEDDIYEICTCEDLQGIGNDSDTLERDYILSNDIDCYDTVNWNYGAGFEPIGDYTSTVFEGNLDGQNNVISELYINRSSENYIGLFGYSEGGISNVGLTDIDITGMYYVGGLVGIGRSSELLQNSYAIGGVTGTNYVGGLVGRSLSSSIDGSYTTGNVTGMYYVGGLVGSSLSSSIDGSYATGNINGDDTAGGLVGFSQFGSINNSYSTGNVNGSYRVGGLIGDVYYASGFSVSDSYSTGNVTGMYYVGGLIGTGYVASIDGSYSTGNVNGTTNKGGLIGRLSSSTLTNNYWNNLTTNPSICYSGTIGISECTAIQNNESYFYNSSNEPMTSWDFVNTWQENEDTLPTLR